MPYSELHVRPSHDIFPPSSLFELHKPIPSAAEKRLLSCCACPGTYARTRSIEKVPVGQSESSSLRAFL